MKIKFWGVRGSIPVPDSRMIKYGGNTTCVEARLGKRLLIIDAGTGIRKLGEDLAKRKIHNFDLFLTHSHWDHIQGFPFFAPVYNPKTNINILGCTSSYKRLKDILSQQMSYEYFPIRFDDLNANILFSEACNDYYKIDGHEVHTIQTNHTIFTAGLSIKSKNNKFVFITDNELSPKKFTTSFEDFVSFCKDADYLIHDAQFTKSEYKKRNGWGHSSFEDALKLALRANVKNLGFTHHDPSRHDNELQLIENKFKTFCKKEGYKINVFAVQEKSEISL